MNSCSYMENSHDNRIANPCQKRKGRTRMDSWGGSGISSGFTQRPQWLTTCPRRKENWKRMDVRLSKTDGGRVGIETEWEQTGFEVAWEQKLRSFITEICTAVLLEALGETEEGTKNVGIWPRTMDGARSDMRMKTAFRKASDFEKNFYKLKNNSVSEKTNWTTCGSV